MGGVPLFFLLQGDPLEKSFLVTVGREDYVANLRHVIFSGSNMGAAMRVRF